MATSAASPISHVESQLGARATRSWLLARMRIDIEGKSDQLDFQNSRSSPCHQVDRGRRGLRVEEGDEEEAVGKEGANKVDLNPLAFMCFQCASTAELHTTTDLPAHQCSLFMTSACAMTNTELPMKVSAVARDTHSITRFCVGVTSSWTAFFTKLRVGSVAGSGFPPGPVVVGFAMLALELEAAMLRMVKAARKKISIKIG
jgi:hypothetical protein